MNGHNVPRPDGGASDETRLSDGSGPMDFTQPHAGISSLALFAVAGLGGWGFYISRAGDGIFRRLLAPA